MRVMLSFIAFDAVSLRVPTCIFGRFRFPSTLMNLSSVCVLIINYQLSMYVSLSDTVRFLVSQATAVSV